MTEYIYVCDLEPNIKDNLANNALLYTHYAIFEQFKMAWKRMISIRLKYVFFPLITEQQMRFLSYLLNPC